MIQYGECYNCGREVEFDDTDAREAGFRAGIEAAVKACSDLLLGRPHGATARKAIRALLSRPEPPSGR